MTFPPRASRRSIVHIFAWPLTIAVSSVIGLVSALIGDGAPEKYPGEQIVDAVAIVVFCVARRHRPRPGGHM